MERRRRVAGGKARSRRDPRFRPTRSTSIARPISFTLATALALLACAIDGGRSESAARGGRVPAAMQGGHSTAEVATFDPVSSSPAQRARIDALAARLAPIVAEIGGRSPEALLLLERDALYTPLSADERALLEALRHQPGADPDQATAAGVEWVRVEGQLAHTEKGDVPIGLQLVTAPVWQDFRALDRAMRAELGRGILIGSGYRSPAYQLQLIVQMLPHFDYSLEKTLVHVSLPGASDHNRVDRLGIDFVSDSGIDLAWSDAAAFTALPQYAWLVAHAREFGFEPDPPKAGLAVASPWHWRWVGKR